MLILLILEGVARTNSILSNDPERVFMVFFPGGFLWYFVMLGPKGVEHEKTPENTFLSEDMNLKGSFLPVSSFDG